MLDARVQAVRALLATSQVPRHGTFVFHHWFLKKTGRGA